MKSFWPKIFHFAGPGSPDDLMDQKSKTFLDAEQEIEKLRFETLNLFDNYNRKCRKHELKMEKEKCYPQLHHSE